MNSHAGETRDLQAAGNILIVAGCAHPNIEAMYRKGRWIHNRQGGF